MTTQPTTEEYERVTRLNVDEFQRFGERAAQAGLDEAALDRLLADAKG